MKIFMAAEITGTVTVRFVSNEGELFHVIGKRSGDHKSVFGCELENDQGEKLREWLIQINGNKKIEKEQESIKKKTCCGIEWNFIDARWSTARCHKCGDILNEPR